MPAIHRSLITVGAAAVVTAAVWAPLAMADDDHDHRKADGREAIGLTTKNTLVSFSTDDPGNAQRIGTIAGLQGDDELVGIDFRVQDGVLYGVGDEGGIYTVDEKTAEADKVEQLSVDLEGEFFGVDFNPAANALRVISDTGQNLRQPFNAVGTVLTVLPDTVTDTPLTNPDGDPARGVTGAAYTNNDVDDATATELFDLDTRLDRLSLQSPANDGTLVPVGELGKDIGPNAGFDIVSSLTDGAATANEAFGVVASGKDQRLVSVDLENGKADDMGTFRDEVVDLALELDE